jgi:hypothetical protein
MDSNKPWRLAASEFTAPVFGKISKWPTTTASTPTSKATTQTSAKRLHHHINKPSLMFLNNITEVSPIFRLGDLVV